MKSFQIKNARLGSFSIARNKDFSKPEALSPEPFILWNESFKERFGIRVKLFFNF
jgi:hypothetical protein